MRAGLVVRKAGRERNWGSEEEDGDRAAEKGTKLLVQKERDMVLLFTLIKMAHLLRQDRRWHKLTRTPGSGSLGGNLASTIY